MKSFELIPYFEEKPWAGQNLKRIFDLKNNPGEAWIVSSIKNKESILLDGTKLSDFVNENYESLGLKRGEQFPVLIKLIDSSSDLSIQLHPNNTYALKKGYPNGKYECWYVLDETKNDKVIAGLKEVDRDKLLASIKNGTIEKYLIYRDIKPHDLIKIVPGTVHAILKNSFFLEVQDPLDVTYRLYDYNRVPKRELHIEDSMNMIYGSFDDKYDLDKYQVKEEINKYVVKIKEYDKFYFEIYKKTYRTFLIID